MGIGLLSCWYVGYWVVGLLVCWCVRRWVLGKVVIGRGRIKKVTSPGRLVEYMLSRVPSLSFFQNSADSLDPGSGGMV